MYYLAALNSPAKNRRRRTGAGEAAKDYLHLWGLVRAVPNGAASLPTTAFVLTGPIPHGPWDDKTPTMVSCLWMEFQQSISDAALHPQDFPMVDR